MKKFLFIQLTDQQDDTKPAGFTKSGMAIVSIITGVLLILSYFVLKNSEAEKSALFLLFPLIVGIAIIFGISFFILKIARKQSPKIATPLSGIPSKEVQPIKRFAKFSFLVSAILLCTSDIITTLAAALLILSSAYILALKNWARILFVTIAMIIIVLNLLSFLSLDTLLEQSTKIVAGTEWNPTYVLLIAVTVKILLTGYLAFGVFFLSKTNIKNLFLGDGSSNSTGDSVS